MPFQPWFEMGWGGNPLSPEQTNTFDAAFFYVTNTVFGRKIVKSCGRFVHKGNSVKVQYVSRYLELGGIICPKDLQEDYVVFVVPTDDPDERFECLGYVTQADLKMREEDTSKRWRAPTALFELDDMRNIEELLYESV